MLADPTFWQTINAHAPIVGWTVLTSCALLCTRFAWKARGGFDDFITGQNADRDLARKTFEGVEAAKREALTQVQTATAHGEAKAAEIRAIAEQNQDKINLMNDNHLAHMELDISKHTELLSSIDRNIAILVDRSRK